MSDALAHWRASDQAAQGLDVHRSLTIKSDGSVDGGKRDGLDCEFLPGF
jgi:hypothetical protein